MLTWTQSHISSVFMTALHTLLVAVAVHAMYGVDGGTSDLSSASRLKAGRKSLLLEKGYLHFIYGSR